MSTNRDSMSKRGFGSVRDRAEHNFELAAENFLPIAELLFVRGLDAKEERELFTGNLRWLIYA